jgi:hypothetical protein
MRLFGSAPVNSAVTPAGKEKKKKEDRFDTAN